MKITNQLIIDKLYQVGFVMVDEYDLEDDDMCAIRTFLADDKKTLFVIEGFGIQGTQTVYALAQGLQTLITITLAHMRLNMINAGVNMNTLGKLEAYRESVS